MADLYRCRGRAGCSREGRPGPFSTIDRHVVLEHGSGRVDAVVLNDEGSKTSLWGSRGGPNESLRLAGSVLSEGGPRGTLPAPPLTVVAAIDERPSDDARALHEPPDPVELKKRAKPRRRPSRARRWSPPPVPRAPRPPLSPETRADIEAAREALRRARGDAA